MVANCSDAIATSGVSTMVGDAAAALNNSVYLPYVGRVVVAVNVFTDAARMLYFLICASLRISKNVAAYSQTDVAHNLTSIDVITRVIAHGIAVAAHLLLAVTQ